MPEAEVIPLQRPQALDLVEGFLALSDGITSPEIFRLWTAIGLVAGCMERRVWAETGQQVLFPNLYTLLVAPPGVGKCLGPDELVLTFDGDAKRARDVQVGDYLIGPDGGFRRVLSTTRGKSQMYKICPNKGEPWICNEDHVLSLRCSRTEAGRGKIKFVSVKDWLKWTPWQKSNWKLWRTGVEKFADRDEPLIDPYFIGVFIGDGASLRENGSVLVTTIDPEIVETLQGICDKYHLAGTAGLLHDLRELGLTADCANKFVSDTYKFGAKEVRQQVLAGLIDTNGSYVSHAKCYDFISKSKQLADDVVFLARSLGLAAYGKECLKSCRNFVGRYYRVSISGEITVIPCRIARNKAQPRQQIKEVNNTGFYVKPLGEGDYAGFTVDGDHQFLLADFTVTHNSSAIKLAEDLWTEIKGLHLAPDSMTSASMLDALADSHRVIIRDGKPVAEYHSLILPADEFSVFCPAYDLEFLGRLNKIYDNPRRLRVRRKYIKDEVNILHPQLNILSGAQPGLLASLLPEEAWSMGFTRRLLMVYAGVGPQVEMFASATDRSDLRKAMLARLQETAQLFGRMFWESEAARKLADWHAQGGPPKPTHSKLVHYNSVRTMHAVKLCMVASAARAPDYRITLVDVDRALSWLFQAELLMPDIFREMVGKSDGDVIRELHFFMWRLWSRDKKPLHESRLINFLKDRVTHEKVLRIIEIAERANIISRQAGTTLYVPKPTTDHGMME